MHGAKHQLAHALISGRGVIIKSGAARAAPTPTALIVCVYMCMCMCVCVCVCVCVCACVCVHCRVQCSRICHKPDDS